MYDILTETTFCPLHIVYFLINKIYDVQSGSRIQ